MSPHGKWALLVALSLFGGGTSQGTAPADLSEADAHYARRSEGHTGALADPRQISEAILGYEAAARDPQRADARWRLARALYFKGRYTGLEEAPRKSVLERAKRVSEEAISVLARRAGARGADDFRVLPVARAASALRGDADAAPALFWGAVAWGEWALAVGKLRAARAGVAKRLRDDCSTLIALDAGFEEGGGYRILGRLHHQAPRIPLLTGWVSREEAIRNLRLAVGVNSGNFVNRHFLAEALADGKAPERAEAIRLEEQLLVDPAPSDHLVESLSIQAEARRNLQAWRN